MESAVLGAVVEDLLSRDRADTGQAVELLERRGVEMYRPLRRTRGGARRRVEARRPARRRLSVLRG
jgi:hypothetical protein